MLNALTKLSSRMLIVLMVGLFLGSCQRESEGNSIRPLVKYYLDQEQGLQPRQLLQQPTMLNDWTPSEFNQMAWRHGNAWFFVEIPKKQTPSVLEFQTRNLIEFQAFLVTQGQAIQPLPPSTTTFSEHYSFQLSDQSAAVLILVKQQHGGIIQGFTLFEPEAFEDHYQLRILAVGLVMGLFLLSFLLTALVGLSQNQFWLLIVIINGLFGLLLEKKIYLLMGLSVGSEVYLKLFGIQLAVNSIAYLKIISYETGLVKIRFQNHIQNVLIISIVIFLALGFLAFTQQSILHSVNNPFQFIVLGFILVYFYCVMALISVWKRRSHLQEFTVVFTVIYALPMLSNMAVKGILPPVFDAWDGNYRAVIPLILSIILYKDRELRLRRLTHLLEIQNRNKDLFLARTSHELRTPLAGMIGMCESILEKKAGLAATLIRKLEVAVSSGRRMNQLIGDITDFTNMRDGKLKLERHPANFSQIFQTMLPLVHPAIERKKLNLKAQIPDNLPKINVDENRIQQVLFNLINNAIKYTQVGEIRLEAKLTDSEVFVIIEDTGIGIPKVELKTIEKDYERATNVDNISGMGLGLSLSKHIIELHHGRLQISSRLGEGTLVSFTLPLVSSSEVLSLEEKNEQPPIDEAEVVDTLPNHSEEQIFKGKAKVVIVDDEDLNVEIFINFLESLDLEIINYSNGSSMLENLTTDEPDLLILDLMMPDLDGYAAIEQIRSEYSSDELPILVVTANEQERLTHKSLTLGANDYLIKPVMAVELRMRVKAQLSLCQQLQMQDSLTELEHQRISLIQEHVRMEKLFDTVDTALVVTDEQDRIILINQGFEKRSGLVGSELLQQHLDGFFQNAISNLPRPSVSQQILTSNDKEEWPCQLSVHSLDFAGKREWVWTLSELSAAKNITDQSLDLKNEPQRLLDKSNLDIMRKDLSRLLELTANYYRLATGGTLAELGEQSGYWHITMNGSTPRAYMLERYLDPKRFPKKPNWVPIIKTCNWILENCEEQQPLKGEILQLKRSVEERII
ncbi:MAG: response regulator [SAR324 cluster bacterium]|nr:response regulator [SAR324 cluster bacterium]